MADVSWPAEQLWLPQGLCCVLLRHTNMARMRSQEQRRDKRKRIRIIKLPLCKPWRRVREVEVQLHTLLDSALEGVVSFTPHLLQFSRRTYVPIHWEAGLATAEIFSHFFRGTAFPDLNVSGTVLVFPLEMCAKQEKNVDRRLCFQSRSQNCEKRLSASSCLSVCHHGTTRLPLDGFSRNLIFEYHTRTIGTT